MAADRLSEKFISSVSQVAWKKNVVVRLDTRAARAQDLSRWRVGVKLGDPGFRYGFDASNRYSISAMSSVVSSSSEEMGIDTDQLVWLLRLLHHHHRRHLIMVWDRWSVHRSTVVCFEKHHPDWFTFELLPS